MIMRIAAGLLLCLSVVVSRAPNLSAAGAIYDDRSSLPTGQKLLEFVERLKPSAVSVMIDDGAGTDLASASGFMIAPNMVVTDHRTVAMGVAGRIRLTSGEMLLIENVAVRQAETNLVILRIKRPEHLDAAKGAPLPIAASAASENDQVLIISSPPGRDPAVAKGRIANTTALPDLGDVIEVETTTLAPGSTGSPVINAAGEVVGVVMPSRDGEDTGTRAIPAARLAALRESLELTEPISLSDYHRTFGESVGAQRIAAEAAAAEKIEATVEKRPDGSLMIDNQYIVRGSGTKNDPYRITWNLLVSASRVYEPRKGKTELPERVMLLHDKWVELTGFIAFPLMAQESDELLLMLNQWDGCCIGVPPTPYDAVEVTLVAPLRMEGGVNIFNYGTVVGRLKVDPYVVNNWLVGLYLMDDATLELEQ